jgi:type I restriction enzyme S subunit
MKVVLLRDVCFINPPKSEAREALNSDDLVSFMPMQDLGIEQINAKASSCKPLNDVIKAYTYFAENDVLIAKITPCFENGKMGIARNLVNGIGFGSSEYFVLRPADCILSEYLYYFLRQEFVIENGKGIMTGAVGHRRVPREYLENLEIPLPSLEKQREIVEKLDSAFAEIDFSYQKTSASLEYLTSCFDSFLDSMLQGQILKYGQNKLVDVLDIARGGSPRPIDSYLTNDEDGVNWIKISDATSSKKYITSTAQKIRPEGVSRSRLVNPGDFLLSNSMSFGRPYIMATTGCIHDGWLVLSNNKKLLNQDYLYYVLGSKYIYEQFDRTAAGSTVRNLNISLAGQVTFPVPDLETQKSLVSHLIDFETSIDELEESLTNKLEKLNELKSSYLSYSFHFTESEEAVA